METYQTYLEAPTQPNLQRLYEAIDEQALNVIYLLLKENRPDLASNTATKAVAALPTFRGNSKFSTWVHRIALNEGISFMRKRPNLETATDPQVLAAIDIPTTASIQQVEAIQEVAQIRKLLTADEKELFDLLRDDVPLRDASRILHIHYSTLQRRWGRMREKIRRLCK